MSLMVLDYKLVKLGPDMGQSEYLRRQAQTCACVSVLRAFLCMLKTFFKTHIVSFRFDCILSIYTNECTQTQQVYLEGIPSPSKHDLCTCSR